MDRGAFNALLSATLRQRNARLVGERDAALARAQRAEAELEAARTERDALRSRVVSDAGDAAATAARRGGALGRLRSAAKRVARTEVEELRDELARTRRSLEALRAVHTGEDAEDARTAAALSGELDAARREAEAQAAQAARWMAEATRRHLQGAALTTDCAVQTAALTGDAVAELYSQSRGFGFAAAAAGPALPLLRRLHAMLQLASVDALTRARLRQGRLLARLREEGHEPVAADVTVAVNDDERAEVKAWVAAHPVARAVNMHRVGRAFEDGVLLADLARHYYPRLVPEDIRFASRAEDNWRRLASELFDRIGVPLTSGTLEQLIARQESAVERVLLSFKRHVDSFPKHRRVAAMREAEAKVLSGESLLPEESVVDDTIAEVDESSDSSEPGAEAAAPRGGHRDTEDAGGAEGDGGDGDGDGDTPSPAHTGGAAARATNASGTYEGGGVYDGLRASDDRGGRHREGEAEAARSLSPQDSLAATSASVGAWDAASTGSHGSRASHATLESASRHAEALMDEDSGRDDHDDRDGSGGGSGGDGGARAAGSALHTPATAPHTPASAVVPTFTPDATPEEREAQRQEVWDSAFDSIMSSLLPSAAAAAPEATPPRSDAAPAASQESESGAERWARHFASPAAVSGGGRAARSSSSRKAGRRSTGAASVQQATRRAGTAQPHTPGGARVDASDADHGSGGSSGARRVRREDKAYKAHKGDRDPPTRARRAKAVRPAAALADVVVAVQGAAATTPPTAGQSSDGARKARKAVKKGRPRNRDPEEEFMEFIAGAAVPSPSSPRASGGKKNKKKKKQRKTRGSKRSVSPRSTGSQSSGSQSPRFDDGGDDEVHSSRLPTVADVTRLSVAEIDRRIAATDASLARLAERTMTLFVQLGATAAPTVPVAGSAHTSRHGTAKMHLSPEVGSHRARPGAAVNAPASKGNGTAGRVARSGAGSTASPSGSTHADDRRSATSGGARGHGARSRAGGKAPAMFV